MPLTPRRQKRVVNALTKVAIQRDGPFSTAPPLQESSSQASLNSRSSIQRLAQADQTLLQETKEGSSSIIII